MRAVRNTLREGAMDSREIFIVGAGGMGREVLWLLRAHNQAGRAPEYRVRGFLCDTPQQYGTQICGVPVAGPETLAAEMPGVAAVCAIGNPRVRRRVSESLRAASADLVTVVHPSVQMSSYVSIGEGSILCANTVITTQVTLGRNVIVNIGSTISHDCELEDYATLSPGVHLAGNVTIGYGAELGTGVSVIPRAHVGRGALVGAGAVVTHNIQPNTVAAGVPARPIRAFSEADIL